MVLDERAAAVKLDVFKKDSNHRFHLVSLRHSFDNTSLIVASGLGSKTMIGKITLRVDRVHFN
jgi:hypothetical protein